MEKIVIYNVKHVKDIIKCAANMRIKSIVLSDDMLSDTLGDIFVSASDYKTGDELPEKSEAKPGNSVMLLINIWTSFFLRLGQATVKWIIRQ